MHSPLAASTLPAPLLRLESARSSSKNFGSATNYKRGGGRRPSPPFVGTAPSGYSLLLGPLPLGLLLGLPPGLLLGPLLKNCRWVGVGRSGLGGWKNCFSNQSKLCNVLQAGLYHDICFFMLPKLDKFYLNSLVWSYIEKVAKQIKKSYYHASEPRNLLEIMRTIVHEEKTRRRKRQQAIKTTETLRQQGP